MSENFDEPTLILNPIESVISGGEFTVSGRFVAANGTGINGATITFAGDNGIGFFLPNTVTSGITFTSSSSAKPIVIAECLGCGHDNEQLRLGTPADNKFVKLYEGSKILLPRTTHGVTLALQGMNQWPVLVQVTQEGGDLSNAADDTTFLADSYGLSPDFALFRISPPGGYIREIQIIDVGMDGDDALPVNPTDPADPAKFMGISSMATFDFEGNPQEQHIVDFEDLSLGSKGVEFSVNDGFFFSTGTAFEDPADTERLVRAETVLDESIIFSEDRKYIVLVATANEAAGGGGEASNPNDYTGSEYSTSPSCSGDLDLDGLCNTWENPPSTDGITFKDGWNNDDTLSLCFSDPYGDVWSGNPADVNKWVCPQQDHKDVFVEIDYFIDHQPDPNAIKDVIKAFGNSPILNLPGGGSQGADSFGRTQGITLHVVNSDFINIHPESLYAWKDPTTGGIPHDTDNSNDFVSLKKKYFGNSNHRQAIISGVGPTATDRVDTTLSGSGNPSVSFEIRKSPNADLTIHTAPGTNNVSGTVIITTTAIFSSSPGSLSVSTAIAGSDARLNITPASITSTIDNLLSSTTRQVTVRIPFRTTVAISPSAPASLGTIAVTLSGTNPPAATLTSLTSPGPMVTTSILDKLAWVYRYGMFIHSYNGVCSPSGLAEVGGNDFIVSLGCNFENQYPTYHTTSPDPAPADGNKFSVGSREDQAGTFMHELGHTLGLYHGAPKTVGGSATSPLDYNANCKPNYPSVMTYTRQFSLYWGSTSVDKDKWRQEGLDYSREDLSTLTESSLSESAGLPVGSAYPSGQTIVWGSPAGVFPYYGKEAAGPNKDWMYNKNVPEPGMVSEDINNISVTGCTGYGSTLNGFVDWSNLQYNFRPASGGFDGAYASPLSLPQEVTPPIYKEMKLQTLLPNIIDTLWIYLLIAQIIIGVIIAVLLIREYGWKWWIWLIIAMVILAIIIVAWVLIDTFR